jgi:hypothetical protein
MALIVKCPTCGLRSEIADGMVGQQIQCPGCKQRLRVGPASGAPTADWPVGGRSGSTTQDLITAPPLRKPARPWRWPLILAVLGVAFVAFSAGALTVGMLYRNRGAGPMPLPFVGKSEDDTPTAAELARHRWWKKPPSAAEVDRIVDWIVGLKMYDIGFVDCDGKFSLVDEKLGAWEWYRTNSLYPSTFRPQGLNERSFWFAMDPRIYSKRPDRAQVLRLLKYELDRSEFKDGPGR